MALFRPQAVRRQDTLHGDVDLVPPVGWQVIGVFLLGSLVLAAAFLLMGSYARTAVAPGVISSDQGVIRVRPARIGAYDRIFVREGQAVRAGDVVAHITLGTSDAGASLEAARADALTRQKLALTSRMLDTRQSADERARALQAQIQGARQQIAGFQLQLGEEARLLAAAQQDLASVLGLERQGYLTQRDLRLREEAVANRKVAISRLDQQIDEQRTAIAVATSDLTRTTADNRSQLDALGSERAELDRAAVGDDLRRGVDVRAPVSGVVTALTAHVGDPAVPQESAMTILPRDARVEAVLSVSPSAAGLLSPGQPLRIAVDAFPFQTFGALPGEVKSISQTTTPPDGRAAEREVFLVHASIPADILAYGRPRPLRPGMTVTARIRTQSRSLGSFLFDPVIAVRRR